MMYKVLTMIAMMLAVAAGLPAEKRLALLEAKADVLKEALADKVSADGVDLKGIAKIAGPLLLQAKTRVLKSGMPVEKRRPLLKRLTMLKALADKVSADDVDEQKLKLGTVGTVAAVLLGGWAASLLLPALAVGAGLGD